MQHDRHLSNGCAAARVDSHRACATDGLSILSSHQLEMCGGGGVFVLTGNFSRKAA